MTRLLGSIGAVMITPSVRVSVFCAGADIEMLENADPYFKYNGAL